MERVKVKAKVSGVHAVSGMELIEGKEYDIDRVHFGHEIMEPIGWTPTDEEMCIQPEPAADAAAATEAPAPTAKKKGKEE